MFDRKKAIKQVIKDNSSDKNILALMIDYYTVCDKLTEDDKKELMDLLYPQESNIENIEK